MKKTIGNALAGLCCLLGSMCSPETGAAAELTVPAFTAYLLPDEGGAGIHREQGITNWTATQTRVQWFGKFSSVGELKVQVKLAGPLTANCRFRVTVGQEEREVEAAAGTTGWLPCGAFQIREAGYTEIRCAKLQETRVDLQALKVSGPAAENAHFNLKPRRNAASVHLFYPLDQQPKVTAFYCEMTAVEDPVWTYYMACGWHRGYFGMQVNSPTERRIIFSVWDSGNEAIDRRKVAAADRVSLVDKGQGVYSGSFGNEGTGGHSHLKFSWKTGVVQRFLVTAEPVDPTHTVFAGYYFRRDLKAWMLISSWKAPREGKYLRGLYSFSENFVGRNGQLIRRARYGNQWVRDDRGKWTELRTARFSHDPTGKADRLDRFMGVEDGEFFLSHGGFRNELTTYGESFQRPATGRSPAAMKLPPLPAPAE